MEQKSMQRSSSGGDVESGSSSNLRLYYKTDWGRWTVDVLPSRGPPERKSFKKQKDAEEFARAKRTELLVQGSSSEMYE